MYKSKYLGIFGILVFIICFVLIIIMAVSSIDIRIEVEQECFDKGYMDYKYFNNGQYICVSPVDKSNPVIIKDVWWD